MDILFIGGVYTREQQDEILHKSRGVVQFAANVLQWNLIRGLDICNRNPVFLLNALFVGAYPSLYADWYINSSEWSHAPGAKDKNVGFLNIFGIKHAWRGTNLAKQAVKWAQQSNTGEKKAIVIYSMHTPFIFAAAMAKRINPDIHVCLVVPDLPDYMNLVQNKNVVLSLFKKMDCFFIDIFLKYIDSFVLLTKHMAGMIGVGNKPWIVMEGMVNPDDLMLSDAHDDEKAKEKVILYTGTLNRAYGIMQLLEAFSMINDYSYRLWICGAGEAQRDIEAAAIYDSRIRYFGQVSREQVLRFQRKARVLINPRSSDGEFTKYSFPSKIMEYLLSGTPAIVHKLPGIPEEYFDYLFTIENETVKAMADKIVEVCNKSLEELKIAGKMAQEFVLTEKNYIRQAEKIYRLISAEP